MPFLHVLAGDGRFAAGRVSCGRSTARRGKTIDFLVELNQQLKHDDRLCDPPGAGRADVRRDARASAAARAATRRWLLVNILRHLGLAARFVSGYLIQLKADVKSLDGPARAGEDFTDLHAWAEVYLPGAGWIGLDPTSGLLAGEGHIPLACTPEPISAAPITGTASRRARCEFDFEMSVTRIHEDPRVTKPYTDEQWEAITRSATRSTSDLRRGDVRLTMGGEPTFVSIDDMEGDEWKTAAWARTSGGWRAT